MMFPLFNPFPMALSANTRVISASTTKAGGIYVAPKNGNITGIGASCSAVSGSPVLDMRVETVNAANGQPTGTLFGTNTNASWSATANAWTWTTLTAAAAVTAGDLIAAVAGYVSGTSGTIRYCLGSALLNGNATLPAVVTMSAGSWANQQLTPMIALRYDDNTVIEGACPAINVATTNFQSGTNPNERALVFTAPFGCNCKGGMFFGGVGTPANATVNLYSGTSTTPLATAIVPTNQFFGNTGAFIVQFPSAVALTAGQTYRISVRSTTTSNISLGQWTFGSTTERDYTIGSVQGDTRNGGSWLGTSNTVIEQIIPMVDSPSAAGGGRVQSLTRGLVD